MEAMIKEYFHNKPRLAVAFSGGVDSAFLLYAAKRYAKEVKAYYVKSQFQPQFELEDAMRLARELDADIKVLELDVLSIPCVRDNPADRCYHCKKAIFSRIIGAAREDGFSVLLDGTNASDDEDDRPGMKALRELRVLSPLRDWGLTKEQIRSLSKQAGLFTWDKPAYACLATRVPGGEAITGEKLKSIEAAEDFLFSMGFKDFRVRTSGTQARLQLREDQLPLLLRHREAVLRQLKMYFKSILLDLEVRQ